MVDHYQMENHETNAEAPLVADSNGRILLEDFSNPINTWKTLNDPVMGGRSHSEFSIVNGTARFTGTCAIVPKLQAPGFITMETAAGFFEPPAKFPDISSCSALQLELQTNVDYDGYRLSFGKAHVKGGRFAYGYKTPLPMTRLPPLGQMGNVTLPFSTFSDKWDDATGDILVECSDDHPDYCPSEKWLRNVQTMSVWAEGVEGDVDLQIQNMFAIGCTEAGTASAAPLLSSKLATIGSNPAYMGMAWVAVMGMILFTLCVGCCCCSRRREAQHKPLATTINGEDDFEDTTEHASYHDDDGADQSDNKNSSVVV